MSVARSYHLVQRNHRTFCYCNVLYHVTTRTELYTVAQKERIFFK